MFESGEDSLNKKYENTLQAGQDSGENPWAIGTRQESIGSVEAGEKRAQSVLLCALSRTVRLKCQGKFNLARGFSLFSILQRSLFCECLFSQWQLT